MLRDTPFDFLVSSKLRLGRNSRSICLYFTLLFPVLWGEFVDNGLERSLFKVEDISMGNKEF